jgi:hypothetical protein
MVLKITKEKNMSDVTDFNSVKEAWDKIGECDDFLREWRKNTKNNELGSVIGAVMNIISANAYIKNQVFPKMTETIAGVCISLDEIEKEIEALKKEIEDLKKS